jgi:hypothetical protein
MPAAYGWYSHLPSTGSVPPARTSEAPIAPGVLRSSSVSFITRGKKPFARGLRHVRGCQRRASLASMEGTDVVGSGVPTREVMLH